MRFFHEENFLYLVLFEIQIVEQIKVPLLLYIERRKKRKQKNGHTHGHGA